MMWNLVSKYPLGQKATYPRIFRRVFQHEKKLKDEYFKGLSIVNPGMLHDGNLFLLDHAVKHLPVNGAVVEIGAFCGLSTNYIAYLLKKYLKANQFFTCDPWDFEEKEKTNMIYAMDIDYTRYCLFVKDSFIRNTKFFNGDNLPHAIQATSDLFFEDWRNKATVHDIYDRTVKLGGEISFAFVDGNHQYEFVKRDFENLHESLVPGGFILFDDSADHFPMGSAKFMNDIKHRKDYTAVAKNPNYLFMKCK